MFSPGCRRISCISVGFLLAILKFCFENESRYDSISGAYCLFHIATVTAIKIWTLESTRLPAVLHPLSSHFDSLNGTWLKRAQLD
ncbi:hypothetical protein AcW1_002008 [Taiwanofungus camphoratus]|nr:hypothetical protein AcW1_002008 [Antrodia cinnamomea]